MGTDGQMSFESNELPIFIYVGLVMQLFTETHCFILDCVGVFCLYNFVKRNIVKALVHISTTLMCFTDMSSPGTVPIQLVPMQYSPGTLHIWNQAVCEP